MTAAAAGCNDNDSTEICVGPDCPHYDGVGGERNFFRSGGAGSAGASGELPDGGPGDGALPDASTSADSGAPPAPACELAFTSPALTGAGDLTVDATSDADDEPCGSQFVLPVALTSNASTVTLFVNDAPVSTQDVVDGAIRFDAALGNRGSTPNVLRAEATLADNSTCSLAFASNILVDCAGPSCSITAPVTNADGYLNGSQDINGAVGLQTDIVVGTEVEHVGQSVRLEIDGAFDTVPDAQVLLASGAGSATFGSVTLAPGLRTVRAQCSDASGLTTLSAPAEFDVDVTPCALSFSSLAGGANPITPAADQNSGADGIQVLADGTITGGDCKTLWIGVCNGALTPLPLTLPPDGSFSLPVTLSGSTGTLAICGAVEDLAGNLGTQAQITANLRLEVPVVSIQSPSNDTQFHVGTTCSAAVAASCSDAGDPVQLLVDGVLADTQTCLGTNEVTLNANLLSKNDGSNTTLTVRQTADGLTSLDASVAVQADCQAPALSFSGFSCGDQLALAGDDLDEGTPGLQFDVAVLNDGAPAVTLTVARGGPGTELEVTGDDTSTTFSRVDLGGSGDVSLSACASDAQGNTGCTASCALTIVAEPSINIDSPLPGALLSSATSDCDGNTPELEVTVQGLTSAADGSSVQVQLGAGAPRTVSASGGAFTACVEALDGNAQTLAASVTDSATTLSGSTSIQLSVDTAGANAIDTLARDDVAGDDGVVVRRRGTLRLKWTSILDSDGDRLSAYRLRCAASAITTELQWAAATNFPVSTLPAASAGSTEIATFAGIDKPGQTRFCALRGEDQSGQLSAIPTNLTLTNPFRSQQYAIADDAVGASPVLVTVEPLGDIDADGRADFAYGSQNQGVQIFLGTNDLDDSLVDVKSPNFAIRNTGAALATSAFGFEVAGLGDINGDTRDDFAISAANDNKVFVFFGRTSNSWLDLDLATFSPCPADLCITGVGAGGAGNFGWDLTSANFDGAGPLDLVISARIALSTQANAGRVYVLLGGTQLATPGSTITLPADNPDGFIIDPPASRTFFGVSVAGVRGTAGVDDLMIGANGATAATANRVTGRALVGAGLTTINAASEFSNGPVGNNANPLRALGDFNGDGRGDLGIERNGNLGGIVDVFLGVPAGGFNTSNVLTFANELFPAFDDNHGRFLAQGFHSTLGSALGALGDLDQDGLTELLTGATTADVPSGAKGLSHLFYGSTNATSRSRASADFTYTPQNTQVVPNFVGDVNQDGFPDFALLDSGTGANVLLLMY